MLTMPWWGYVLVLLLAAACCIAVIAATDAVEKRRKKGEAKAAAGEAAARQLERYQERLANEANPWKPVARPLPVTIQTEAGIVAPRAPDQPTTMAPGVAEARAVEAERTVPRYYPGVEAERNAITPPAGTSLSDGDMHAIVGPADTYVPDNPNPPRKRKKAPKKAPAKRKPKKASKRK